MGIQRPIQRPLKVTADPRIRSHEERQIQRTQEDADRQQHRDFPSLCHYRCWDQHFLAAAFLEAGDVKDL